MQGIIRASARLLVMALVMAAVLGLAVYAGLGATTAIGIGIVVAGLVGMFSVVRRRPPKLSPHDEIAAMMAPQREATSTVVHNEQATSVEAMAPPHGQVLDPEANMPRWRRPSLLEARRADPTRQAPAYRAPQRFTDDQVYQYDVRTVRYAVVPLLDRPDELMGARTADLESGDEVQVLSAQGTFLEVHCPNGQRGWVHRTTLAQRQATPTFAPVSESHEDMISALLAARGFEPGTLNQA